MFENGKRPHITVVGDLILDRYLIGDATKLNPEQPGVVIRVDKEEDRLGGAAAVAMIAAGFGARVTLAGVVGRDEPGRRLQQLIADHGIEPHFWLDDRPTTWKQRIVARGQIRPDRCDREVSRPASCAAIEFLSGVQLGDALLIQDYGKGACVDSVLRTICTRAHQTNTPILVDPAHTRPWTQYGKVYLIKANEEEARQQLPAIESPTIRARHLARQHGCNVIVTHGARGMLCATSAGDTWHIPAKQVFVRDVCGAGDTVLAAVGVFTALRKTLPEICTIAASLAARQVEEIGVARIVLSSDQSNCLPAMSIDGSVH